MYVQKLLITDAVKVMPLSCDENSPAENIEVKLKRKMFCKDYDNEIRPGKIGEKTMLNFRFRVKTFDFVSAIQKLLSKFVRRAKHCRAKTTVFSR